MEVEISLQCLHELVSELYPEPDETNPDPLSIHKELF